MKKFYEYMEKNDYGISFNGRMEEEVFFRLNGGIRYYLSSTDLTGHMIKYLVLKGFISFRQYGIWLADEIKHYLLRVDKEYDIDKPSEIMYEILKEKIEESK